MIRLICALALCALPALAEPCRPRDFLTVPLPGGDAIAVALETAYPGVTVSHGTVTIGDRTLPLGGETGRPAKERIERPTIAEQFTEPYPLAFTLTARERPWADPGRARDPAFFAALWFSRESAARATLKEVPMPGSDAVFRVTTKHGVACQLAAALKEIAASGVDWAPQFASVGGGFLWRKIAGSPNLSAHSYGIAIDLNPELGGYWRWSGAQEGAAGPYDNHMPREIVKAFERRGFIWGGKWHHFDGMHFEYRPELILYARAHPN